MFLKNKNIIFKIRRSKVTDYAALRDIWIMVPPPYTSPIIYEVGCDIINHVNMEVCLILRKVFVTAKMMLITL